MISPTWIDDGSRDRGPVRLRRARGEVPAAPEAPEEPRRPGGAFQLDPWQERIVRRIYGPRHEDGSRIVRTVVLLLPRGNRKTSLAAALALLHTIGPERVPGGQSLAAGARSRRCSSPSTRPRASCSTTSGCRGGCASVTTAAGSPTRTSARATGAIACRRRRQHGKTPNVRARRRDARLEGRAGLWEALRVRPGEGAGHARWSSPPPPAAGRRTSPWTVRLRRSRSRAARSTTRPTCR